MTMLVGKELRSEGCHAAHAAAAEDESPVPSELFGDTSGKYVSASETPHLHRGVREGTGPSAGEVPQSITFATSGTLPCVGSAGEWPGQEQR
jgi:hypothetical protein